MGIQSSKDSALRIQVTDPKDRAACLESIQQGIGLSSLDPSGRSPLRQALALGDSAIFLALIQAKAPLHPPLPQQQTPLHYAVLKGHSDLVKEILRNQKLFPGMKNARDSAGRTALHLAVLQGSPELVASLLKYNCDQSLCDYSGATAKDLALESMAQGALEMVDQLSAEDVMNKPRSKRTHPPLSKPILLPDFTPKEPLSRGASSHGSKSTLKSQASAVPPVTDEVSGVDLDEEIKQNCIPLIRGTELTFEEVINRGSSCEVFKGRWRGCEVAIKKFKSEYKQNSKELSKFVKEMQSLAQVRHPNLILLMGICTDLPNLCLVTEYVPNQSLFYALHSNFYTENKSRRLTLPERFQVAIHICKGLAYMHECDPPIIHRDLKPENCLLDFSLNLKIADFGLARPLTCFSNEEALTTTCIGTTRFMAPELFEKEKLTSIGVEVDIWALGCILIELFSNKRPWDYISSSNASSIYYEVRTTQIFQKKPVPVPDSIPAEVRSVIQRCCQYSPKRRPAAGEVLEQLQVLSPQYV